MKTYNRETFELLAVALTAILKILLMDWLKLGGIYIIGISLFWLSYLLIGTNTKKELKTWGFKSRGFRQSVAFLFPFCILTCFACLTYAYLTDSLFFSWHVVPIFLLYPIWGLIQQFLMLGIVLPVLATVFGTNINRLVLILIVSALFSLMHYSSTFLMAFSFCLEALFVTSYLKWRNLWAIGLIHGWTATFILHYIMNRDLWLELMSSF